MTRPAPDGLAATVGSRLRTLRIARNETQVGVGKAVGIHHSTLSFYEMGKREPSLDALIALARYFGVPLAAIVSEEDS